MRFSIVTISYNQGRFLERSIQSVVRQRDDDIDLEYIVVDPGSTDSSRAILEKHSHEIDHLVLEPDTGPADGLAKGFRHASGDVFGFLNADDLLASKALATIRDFLHRHPDCQAVTGCLRVIDEHGNPARHHRAGSVLYPARYSLRHYLDGSMSPTQPSTFFRESAWRSAGGINPRSNIWDGELIVDALLAGVRFHRLPRVLASFRRHPDSMTSSRVLRRQRAEEKARLKQRIIAAGFRPSPTPVAAVRRALWRLRPANRLLGWWVHWRERQSASVSRG